MSEQDETIRSTDDTEAHVFYYRGQDENQAEGEGKDTEGHVFYRGQDENQGEDEDTEGHFVFE